MDFDKCTICLENFPVNSIKNYNEKRNCKCIIKCCDSCNDHIKSKYDCLICRKIVKASTNILEDPLENNIDQLIQKIGDNIIMDFENSPIFTSSLYIIYSFIVFLSYTIPKKIAFRLISISYYCIIFTLVLNVLFYIYSISD